MQSGSKESRRKPGLECSTAFINCVYFAQWDYYDDEPGVWLVEPDGFCAWGRRKEVSDDADR